MEERTSVFEVRLESLRGVAAFGVAWAHGNVVFETIGEPSSYPLLLAWRNWLLLGVPAGASVVLFFALSGFVLGASLKRDNNIRRYIVRRLFRIFPALWFAVTVTYAMQSALASHFDRSIFSESFRFFFLGPQTVADFLRNLVLAKKSIDPVIWSLIPEVVCSLLLPLLVWLHQQTNRVGRAIILISLAIFGYFSESGAMQYLFAFYAGFCLPSDVIAANLNSPVRSTIAAIAGWFLLVLGNAYGVPYTPIMREACTLGAVILIGSIVSTPVVLGFLRLKAFRFLGRVSYSFYLLHLPTLFLLSYFVQLHPALVPHNAYSAVLFAAISILLALPIAALSYKFIEVPGIDLGRKIAQWSNSRLVKAATEA